MNNNRSVRKTRRLKKRLRSEEEANDYALSGGERKVSKSTDNIRPGGVIANVGL
jgi:hypothetical protein